MKRWKKFCVIAAATFAVTSTTFSAGGEGEPSEVKAETIDYDMDSGVVSAAGNVFVKHTATEKSSTSKNDNVPSEVTADDVQYDMNNGTVTANGNVILKYGDGRATGGRAMYNTNTQEAYLLDNVTVTRNDLKITCGSLRNDGQGHMQADGNVYVVQTVPPNEKYPNGDTRTFRGEHVDYYPNDRGHVFISTGGIITNSDGTFTADQMEAWLDEEHYVGTGNAHVVNPPRQLEAGGDRIDYYAGEDGKAVLSGNAWANQNNNTMRGNRLTVYLADDNNLKVTPSAPKATELPGEDKPFADKAGKV